MGGQYLSTALFGLLAVLLAGAAISDLRTRTISNRLTLAVALMAPLYWVASGLTLWPDMAVQAGLGLGMFALFTAAFAAGMMGGGDVKLIAALALWLPWQALLEWLMLMAVLGGIVTLVLMLHHRLRARTEALEIPYGVAIAGAALWVFGKRYLNQFA